MPGTNYVCPEMARVILAKKRGQTLPEPITASPVMDVFSLALIVWELFAPHGSSFWERVV
jgi:hypothetical protein